AFPLPQRAEPGAHEPTERRPVPGGVERDRAGGPGGALGGAVGTRAGTGGDVPGHRQGIPVVPVAGPGGDRGTIRPPGEADMRVVINGVSVLKPKTGVGHTTAHLHRALTESQPADSFWLYPGETLGWVARRVFRPLTRTAAPSGLSPTRELKD